MKTLLIAATTFALALGTGCVADEGAIEDIDFDGDDVASEQLEVTGPGSFVSYSKALVRLDFKGGGRCSAVLVGPNLLATAAHCVSDKTIDGVKTWNNMKYGKIQVRMVYKPSSSEVMCLNEPCRSGGVTQYSTIYAFWDSSYSGTGDWSSDMAVLTRISQNDFITEPADEGDPAPRSLGSSDFLRIMRVALPTSGSGWEMRIAGYGAAADGVSTALPRAGFMQINDWNTHTMESTYQSGSFWSSFCKGDSGGPVTYTAGIGGRTYVGGVIVGFNDSISGSCPEPGDDVEFNRMNSKVWMLNHVRQWVEGKSCTLFSTDSLPGSGEYYKCW